MKNGQNYLWRKNNMFLVWLLIGFIVGFVVGWIVINVVINKSISGLFG